MPHKGVHFVCHVKITILANLRRNADVRETRAGALTIKGNGVREVSVPGKPPCSHLEVALPHSSAAAWEVVHTLR